MSYNVYNMFNIPFLKVGSFMNEMKTENVDTNGNTPAGGDMPEKSPKKKLVAVVLVIILLLALGVVVFLVLRGQEESEGGTSLGYEGTAYTVTDEKTLQDMVNEMMAKDGQMALEYSPGASSSDGKNFSCNIVNSAKNQYDMYLGIYSDDALTDELYLTQLIRPGDGIESFTTSRELEEGSHSCILVFTQVEDDHQTIHAQVKVVYTLSVSD